MSKDKPTQSGGLEHAVFRIADAQQAQAREVGRLVDELALWRKLLERLIEEGRPQLRTEGT